MRLFAWRLLRRKAAPDRNALAEPGRTLRLFRNRYRQHRQAHPLSATARHSREGGFSMMSASHGGASKLKPACFGLRPCSFARGACRPA